MEITMYLMAVTFEKPQSNVLEIIWTNKTYYHLSDCFLYENNPYIEGVHEAVSDDLSYVEYVIPFHDKNFYELWFDEFKDVYLGYREQVFADLKKSGVIIQDYLQSLDVDGTTDTMKPISEFVTKFPEKLSQFSAKE